MNLYKKSFITTIVMFSIALVVLVQPMQVLAQEFTNEELGLTDADNEGLTISYEDPNEYYPELYVHRFDFENDVMRTGDTLYGSFNVTNVKDFFTDFTYAVELVGEFVDGAPKKIYDISLQPDVIRVAANGETRVRFTYDLPQQLPSKDLGLQIKLFFNETYTAARASTPIDVRGEVLPYINFYTELRVAGETFRPLEGPYVAENENLRLFVSLRNDTDEAVKLTPSYVIFDGQIVGDIIETNALSEIVIAADEVAEQEISLPVFEDGNGVYTALVVYKDQNGFVRSGPFEVRYIMGSVNPQIESIIPNDVTLLKNQAYTIATTFSDAPVNIRKNNSESERALIADSMGATVVITDQVGTEVFRKTVAAQNESNVLALDFTAPKNIIEYAITVDLLQNGEIVDSKTEYFTGDNSLIPEEDTAYMRIMLISIILLLVMIISYIVVRIPKTKKKSVATLGVLLFAGSLFFAQAIKVEAAIVHVQSATQRAIYLPNSFNLQSPLPPAVKTYQPGESIPFRIDFNAGRCNNGPHVVDMRITEPLAPGVAPAGNWKGWSRVGSQGGNPSDHDDSNARWSKSLGTLTAPSEPGIYRVYFHIKNQVNWSNGGSFNNYYIGYSEIEVKRPESDCERNQIIDGSGNCVDSGGFQLSSCIVQPNPVEIGGSTRFTVRAANANGSVNYKWYTDNSVSGTPIQENNGGAQSTYRLSQSTAGIHSLYVKGTDAAGSVFTQRCSASFRTPDDLGADLGVDESGVGVFDPTLPPPELNVAIDRNFTNTSCVISWDTKYALQCGLVEQSSGSRVEVDLEGELEVSPGTYRLVCRAQNDGTEVQSEAIACRQNFDIREV